MESLLIPKGSIKNFSHLRIIPDNSNRPTGFKKKPYHKNKNLFIFNDPKAKELTIQYTLKNNIYGEAIVIPCRELIESEISLKNSRLVIKKAEKTLLHLAAKTTFLNKEKPIRNLHGTYNFIMDCKKYYTKQQQQTRKEIKTLPNKAKAKKRRQQTAAILENLEPTTPAVTSNRTQQATPQKSSASPGCLTMFFQLFATLFGYNKKSPDSVSPNPANNSAPPATTSPCFCYCEGFFSNLFSCLPFLSCHKKSNS